MWAEKTTRAMSSSPEPLQLLPADEYEADEAIARLTALTRKLRDARRDQIQSGLRLDLGFRGQRFIAPWKRSEQFFRNGLGNTPLELNDPDLQRFMAKWAGGPLCYGYPCYVNDAGHVLPLLFCDVRLRIGGGGQVEVHLDRDSRPQINQRVLIDHGFDRSTADELVSDLTKRDYDSFDACLSHVSTLLGGADDAEFRTESLDAWPLEDRTPGWRNTPILFAPVEEQSQASISAELESIELTIRQASRHTSLHAFFDHEPRPIDRAVEPLAPFVADSGRDPVLKTCLSSPLTYLTAPPGSGRLPLICNLVSSHIATGGSVLFVSPHGHVIDQVSGQLEAVLQRAGCWIHRLEKKGAGDELVRSFDDAAQIAGGARPIGQVDSPLDQRANAAADHLADVEGRLRTLQQAQWRVSVARTEAAEIFDTVSEQWQPLFQLGHDIALDRRNAEKLIEQAENLVEAGKGNGLRRILGKSDDRPAFDDIVRQIVAAISGVPRSVAEPIEAVLSKAAHDRDIPTLLDAARALDTFSNWKEAAARADGALDDIGHLPDMRTLARHLSAAQSAINKGERAALAQAWIGRIEKDLAQTAARLRDFMAIRSDRLNKQKSDEWSERKMAQAMRDIYPAVPFWTGRIESVIGRLPLDPALFDLVIIEDAQAVDAGALFPLLYRARQSVVIGTRAAIGHHEATAAGLMCDTKGCQSVLLADCARGHPAITWAMSQSAHAGKLRSMANAQRLTGGVDPSQTGLHWHEVTGQGDHLADRQLDSVLSLVVKWHEQGLFELTPPKMVGIANSCPTKRGMLMAGLANLLPKSMVLERIAVAGPDRFHSQVVDFLILVPIQDGDAGSDRAQRLAQSALMYHDAVGAAKVGIHVVGDRKRAKADGGLLAKLSILARPLSDASDPPPNETSPTALLSRLLTDAGISHHPVPRGLLAFGQLGTVYEFIVPGGRKKSADDPLDGTVMSLDLTQDDLVEPSAQLISFIERLA